MTAIRGTFADAKSIKSRGVYQLLIEIPIENADHALHVLGGIPQPAEERWVGVAPIRAPEAQEQPSEVATERSKRPWGMLTPTEQAGIACKNPYFQRWICLRNGNEPSEECATRMVHALCHVSSRRVLNESPSAAAKWHALHDDFYASQKGQTLEDQQRQLEAGRR